MSGASMKNFGQADYDGYVIQTSSIQDLTGFLLKLRGDHLSYVSYAGLVETSREKSDSMSRIVYDLEHAISDFAQVFGVIALILLVVLLLMVVNLISFSVTNRKMR